MGSHQKGDVQCLQLILWKQLVSEVRTWEKICFEHVREYVAVKKINEKVDNVTSLEYIQ